MRCLFSLLFLTAGLLAGTAGSLPADELFSEDSLAAPFDPNAIAKGGKGSAPVPQLTDAKAIRACLGTFDHETEVLDSQTISIQLPAEGWTFPTRLRVDVERNELEVVLLLKKIEPDPTNPSLTTSLLQLMTLNRALGFCRFGFDPANKRIELQGRISNRGVTKAVMKQVLEELAKVAADNEAAWSKIKPPMSAKQLVGTWATDDQAKRSVAVQFETGGDFFLVIVQDDQPRKQRGTYEIKPRGTLTLSGGDGTVLSGTVKRIDEDTLRWQITQTSQTIVLKRSK